MRRKFKGQFLIVKPVGMFIYHYQLKAEREKTISVIILIYIYFFFLYSWVLPCSSISFVFCWWKWNPASTWKGEDCATGWYLAKVPFKLRAVCQSFRDICIQVKPTRSKRSRSTHYLILEKHCHIFSPIKVICKYLPKFLLCSSFPFASLNSLIFFLDNTICLIYTFLFQLAVYCATQAGGLSGEYLDIGKCKGLSNLGHFITHNT